MHDPWNYKNKLNSIEIKTNKKNDWSAKDPVKSVKRQRGWKVHQQLGEKKSANHLSGKLLAYGIYNEVYKLNSKKKIQLENGWSN